MPLLPRGHRVDDPEQKGVSSIRFRLALLVRRYPIQIALIIALAATAYPVVLLVDAKNDLEAATKANRELTLKVGRVAVQANELARDFQAQRIENVRKSCEDQNAKHDNTTEALMQGAGQDIANAPNAAARKEIRRRRDVTLGLLNALAEHRDCDQAVRDAQRPPRPKPSPTPTATPTATP